MSKMSHINVIDKYEEHQDAIHHLLSSILNCFSDAKMFDQSLQEFTKQLNALCNDYPFASQFYLLNPEGKPICMNVPGRYFSSNRKTGHGSDRSKRAYYMAATNSTTVEVSEPCLSSARRDLCVSASIKIGNGEGSTKGIIVLDIDLVATISFLTGNRKRFYFEPYFKVVYLIIVFGLLCVALLLLYLAGKECWSVVQTLANENENKLLPFGVVIYTTLVLAIFDLGKTTLEAVLYIRYRSTRRTITRFIAAIIIAVSIESLLMIVKLALKDSGEFIIQAVWIILAAGFLLLCMAIYVYLGSMAEAPLLNRKINKESGS